MMRLSYYLFAPAVADSVIRRHYLFGRRADYMDFASVFMATRPLILILDRDLRVLHAQAGSVLKDLFGYGLNVAVAGFADEKSQEAWQKSGVDLHPLPIGVRPGIKDRLAAPVLVSQIAANPPTLLHVADPSLLPVAHFIKATFPSMSVVVEADEPPAWLHRLNEIPDGTGLVEDLLPKLGKLPLLGREGPMNTARQASARLVGGLRGIRTASWIDAWLVRTREGEKAFEELTTYQAGKVASHEYRWGVDNNRLLVEGERGPIQQSARDALSLKEMRGYVSAPLMRGDDESFATLVSIIERSLNRVPQLGWILFGDAPEDASSRKRLNELMEEGGVEFLPGYESRHLAYHASDILLSAGKESAQPWLMEMCATRAPVLGADSPRNRLCIRPGENGFLVEQDDLDAWIERIRYFIDRPEQRDVMGVRSRQLAMRLFDSQLMQRRLFRTWDAVMREQFESAEIKEQAEPPAANRKRDRDLLDEG